MAKRMTRSRMKPRRSAHYLKGRNSTSGVEKTSPNNTMEIIDKLSKQFKKTDKGTSVKKSRDGCLRKEVLNSSLAHNWSYRITSNDASFSSTPASDNSRKSVDFYDFNEKDDAIRLRLDLSPIKVIKTPASSRRTNRKRSADLFKAQSSGSPSQGHSSKKRKVDSAKIVREKNARNKMSSMVNTQKQVIKTVKTPDMSKVLKESTPSLEAGSSRKTRSAGKKAASTVSSPSDSGIFLTPPSLTEAVTRDNTPAPTLNLIHAAKQKDGHDKENSDTKCRKKKNRGVSKSPPMLLPESPMLSPVQKVMSPSVGLQGDLVTSQSELFEDISLTPATGDLESHAPTKRAEKPETSEGDKIDDDGSYKALDISRTYSSLGYGYFAAKSAEKKKTKKGTKKEKKEKRFSVSRYEEVANRMNQEFEDLESFEFSLD